MADERDSRRKPHRDHSRSRADTPRAGVASGELDSGDGIVTDPVDPDDTPVEALIAMVEKRVGLLSGRDKQVIREIEEHRKRGQERRERPPAVEVDPSAFEPDPRWRDFDEMRDEVKACREERLSRAKRAKWLNPLRNVGVGTLIAALLWTVRALSQHGADEEKARQRNAQVEQNRHDIRELQDWKIRAEVLLGLRARFTQPDEPDRSDP